MTSSGSERFANVHFPTASGASELAQDEEWFEVTVDGEPRRIRFHDYGAIYEIPGLYERLFYDVLECRSPQTVVGLLESRARARRGRPGVADGARPGSRQWDRR